MASSRLGWRRPVRIVVIVLSSVVALVLLLFFYLWITHAVWYPRQRAHIRDITEIPLRPADEDRFSSVPLDDAIPYNNLRMIATHNSYHTEPDALRRFLIGLVEPEERTKLAYSHRPLWEQLESGIRSFELDVRYSRTLFGGERYRIIHAPLVDNRGMNPDLRLALQEIALWSERRPGHVPVVVLLELKSDWMILDPRLKPWDRAALAGLDELITESITADRLFTPDDLRGGADSPGAAIQQRGWPSLGEMRGHIILVLHANDQLDPLYVESDPALTGRPMFTSSSPDGLRPDALFVIHNEPIVESIDALVEADLIVRTRSDGDGELVPEVRNRALASAAQIVSTDVPPGHVNDPSLTPTAFATGKTLTVTRPDAP